MSHPRPARGNRPNPPDVLLAALEELAGRAVLLLDLGLRVTASSPGTDALLGQVPHGVSAPKLLCGQSVDRPIAEALAAGRPVSASIERPGRAGAVRLRVSALPVHQGGKRVGWALLLEPEPGGGGGPELFQGMWSAHPATQRVFRIVEKVARSEASVLVRGETGAGKELVAAALHRLSARSSGPFHAINCAAVSPALLESELFGHVRGSFTGAVRDAPGHFRLAGGGTLFLDEVAELPLELQAKLLRVLETRTILPVGGREPVPVDVRIVAATHRALRREVEAGRFRADLMYRLRVIPIFLPPLRARGEDVLLLAERFIADMNARAPRHIAHLSAGAREILLRHDWPGNVRELKNVLEYAFAIGEGPIITPSDLPLELLTPAPSPSENVPPPLPAAALRSPEAARIARALERAGGSRTRAAASLGVSRITLWRRMRELGLASPGR